MAFALSHLSRLSGTCLPTTNAAFSRSLLSLSSTPYTTEAATDTTTTDDTATTTTTATTDAPRQKRARRPSINHPSHSSSSSSSAPRRSQHGRPSSLVKDEEVRFTKMLSDFNFLPDDEFFNGSYDPVSSSSAFRFERAGAVKSASTIPYKTANALLTNEIAKETAPHVPEHTEVTEKLTAAIAHNMLNRFKIAASFVPKDDQYSSTFTYTTHSPAEVTSPYNPTPKIDFSYDFRTRELYGEVKRIKKLKESGLPFRDTSDAGVDAPTDDEYAPEIEESEVVDEEAPLETVEEVESERLKEGEDEDEEGIVKPEDVKVSGAEDIEGEAEVEGADGSSTDDVKGSKSTENSDELERKKIYGNVGEKISGDAAAAITSMASSSLGGQVPTVNDELDEEIDPVTLKVKSSRGLARRARESQEKIAEEARVRIQAAKATAAIPRAQLSDSEKLDMAEEILEMEEIMKDIIGPRMLAMMRKILTPQGSVLTPLLLVELVEVLEITREKVHNFTSWLNHRHRVQLMAYLSTQYADHMLVDRLEKVLRVPFKLQAGGPYLQSFGYHLPYQRFWTYLLQYPVEGFTASRADAMPLRTYDDFLMYGTLFSMKYYDAYEVYTRGVGSRYAMSNFAILRFLAQYTEGATAHLNQMIRSKKINVSTNWKRPKGPYATVQAFLGFPARPTKLSMEKIVNYVLAAYEENPAQILIILLLSHPYLEKAQFEQIRQMLVTKSEESGVPISVLMNIFLFKKACVYETKAQRFLDLITHYGRDRAEKSRFAEVIFTYSRLPPLEKISLFLLLVRQSIVLSFSITHNLVWNNRDESLLSIPYVLFAHRNHLHSPKLITELIQICFNVWGINEANVYDGEFALFLNQDEKELVHNALYGTYPFYIRTDIVQRFKELETPREVNRTFIWMLANPSYAIRSYSIVQFLIRGLWVGLEHMYSIQDIEDLLELLSLTETTERSIGRWVIRGQVLIHAFEGEEPTNPPPSSRPLASVVKWRIPMFYLSLRGHEPTAFQTAVDFTIDNPDIGLPSRLRLLRNVPPEYTDLAKLRKVCNGALIPDLETQYEVVRVARHLIAALLNVGRSELAASIDARAERVLRFKRRQDFAERRYAGKERKSKADRGDGIPVIAKRSKSTEPEE
eukprot:TRINITY_DN287_c1_g1_i1.p1 TRINITY_DN287_c1_g1~~TRINITY_DN287_c1_g1_i1.p1  ORF type:complete len:1199 (-),score=354.65 TRINITY_DN287_c1_g1_i1:98-3511(-)